MSAVEASILESVEVRIDFVSALDESFKDFTINDKQQAQLLDLCVPSIVPCFSLFPGELGNCTTAEARFLLQPQAKQVDHHSYKTNPKAQEVIDKCVESIEPDGIIEKSP